MKPLPDNGNTSIWRAVVAVLCLSIWAPAAADAVHEETVAKVKSAYLLNFMRFAQWPDDAFDSDASPFRLCIVGYDSLGSVLDGTMNDVSVAGHPVQIKRMTLSEDALPDGIAQRLGNCHLVFLGHSESPRVDSILSALDTRGTLTVGETGAFAGHGAMLALNLEGDRIVFYANRAAVRATDVQLSSKIMQLARIVDGDLGR